MQFSQLSLLATISILASITTSTDVSNYNYTSLRVQHTSSSVLEVTIHSPKSAINLFDSAMLHDFQALVLLLQKDNTTKAVIFKSDVPKYFIAHADLYELPFDPNLAADTVEMLFNMTNLPQVTIGAVEGVARGAGNELFVSLDMRFSTKTHVFFGQPEIGLGIGVGAGGIQYLSRLVGRGRAMEYILAAKDINANDAERIGWINCAFDTAPEMYAHITTLTSQLSLFPLRAIANGKSSINAATRPPLTDSLEDAKKFMELFEGPAFQTYIDRTRGRVRYGEDSDTERFLGEELLKIYAWDCA